MQAKGFFASLFDYSFSSYITPRIIRVLYVLATVLVALWTLFIVLVAFKASSALGVIALLIGGPIYFVLAMIGARVGLEFLSAFFRIHEHVQAINQSATGTAVASVPWAPESVTEPTDAVPVSASSPAPEPAVTPSPASRFCANCGVERTPGRRFCTGCGEPLD